MNNSNFSTRQAVNRLARRLQLPDTTTSLQISSDAQSLAQITITRMLTEPEIKEIATWYVVEGVERIPSGTTTYDLEARQPIFKSPPATDCDPVAQQQRQDQLEELYVADGRKDPAHPHHGTYTGLVAGFQEPAAASGDG